MIIYDSLSTTGSAQEKKAVLWNRNFTLVCVYSLIIFISFHLLTPTLPVYINSLGWSNSIVGLLAGVYMLAAVLFRPWIGRALDLYGRTHIWAAGTLIFMIVNIAYSWAVSLPLLLMLRIVHGISWGIIITASSVVATDIIPPKRMGEGMGFFALGSSLGMGFGPVLGFFLIGRYNFFTLFCFSAFLSLTALMLIKAVRLPKVHSSQEKSKSSLWESTAVRPSVLIIFGTCIIGGITTYLALYGAENGIANTGFFFAAYALFLLAGRPLGGYIYDRTGPRVILIFSFLFLIVGMAILSIRAEIETFLISAVFCGMGIGSLHPVLQAQSVAHCPPFRRGAAQATFTAAYDIGIGFGSIFLGFLARYTGYGGMYLSLAAAAFVGLLIHLFFNRDKSNVKQAC